MKLHSLNYSAVLTVALWSRACPCPIIDRLAGTRDVSVQCESIVTKIGGGCTYKRWSFWWFIGHIAICDGQSWTPVS